MSTTSIAPNLDATFYGIANWAHDRNLILGSSSKDQLLKLTEELGEVVECFTKSKPKDELKYEIGDMIVVLTILAEQNHLSVQECAEAAYNKIKDRKGQMRDGIFVKEEDLDAPQTSDFLQVPGYTYLGKIVPQPRLFYSYISDLDAETQRGNLVEWEHVTKMPYHTWMKDAPEPYLEVDGFAYIGEREAVAGSYCSSDFEDSKEHRAESELILWNYDGDPTTQYHTWIKI